MSKDKTMDKFLKLIASGPISFELTLILTEEEAELIAPRVTGKNVVLITNSDHMPRAIKYFHGRVRLDESVSLHARL